MESKHCIVQRTIKQAVIGMVLACTLHGAVSEQQTNQTNVVDLKDLNLEQLGTIEVTTFSKEPAALWTTPAAIHVITREDIRQSGVTSIPEALRLAPGVEVARKDSDHWAIGIRGFTSQFSSSVLVLIDGRSVYTPLFAGVFWDVQDILLEDIDRIEVIRGPGGTIWGANAFSGVINIITKAAKDTHGLLATAGGGNLDQAFGGFRYGGGDGRQLDYRFYGKIFTRGPQFHPDNKLFDDWRMGRLGFRLDRNSQGAGSWTVQGDLYKGATGETVSVGSFSPPSQINLEGNDDVSGGNLLAHWRKELSKKSSVQVRTYYDRTNRIAPHFEETRDTFDIDFLHQMELGGRHELLWGLGLRLSAGRFTQRAPSLDFDPHKMTDAIGSVFLQDEFHLVPSRLALTIGTKVEHNSYTNFEIQPSVRATWTPKTSQTFWAAVTRAVRTPSRLEADFRLLGFLQASPLLYVQIVGSPNSESERMIGYELGHRTLLASSLYLDSSVFHNDYDDLFDLGSPTVIPERAPIPFFALTFPYVNGVKGRTNGFEVAPDWQVVPQWQLKGAYSYLNLDVRNKPGNSDISAVKTYEGSSPRHRVILQSVFRVPRKFDFEQTYRYVSALPAQNVRGYMTADVRVSHRFGEGLDFEVTGQNLFQPHHAEFSHDAVASVGVKRTVFAKLTYTK